MPDIGPVELLFMYYELTDPCVDIMVKWQHRGVTYSDPEIEHAEPLGSIGLNGAGDDPTKFTPTGGKIETPCTVWNGAAPCVHFTWFMLPRATTVGTKAGQVRAGWTRPAGLRLGVAGAGRTNVKSDCWSRLRME
ncbi:hypothetical protein F511_33756 [Dorcoceras hygrometricum]|uniref:Uncharacterized protein n=1 Tax=Dorcoceras hygrometricum TaxID=472368 RepID=A0A2Z7BVD3_9LAMI|nr:hypothetical protein F511_33756 [Dorcoceras hygrometricum]